jgi:RNA polymerase sigma-70 factor (ECF subfamily)
MSTVDANQFETYRPLMLSIAYRMLGSVTEAEDIVQEAYLRYQATAQEQIGSHKAFLSTIVTRLCLDHLRSARAQRESYFGPWLPEPVLTDQDERFAPLPRVELHESLSMAFLVLLEQLTPLERAVFLLRQVFDYDYGEIAEVIDKSEVACRQLFSRAKKHIAGRRPRFQPSPETHRQMLDRFIQAVDTGELAGLMQLLTDDVVLVPDTGGKAGRAIVHPLRGRAAVARFLLAAARSASEVYNREIHEVNGEPTLILRAGSEVRYVMSIDVEQERVAVIRVIVNPDKLKWIR